jgi:hypothetical protein
MEIATAEKILWDLRDRDGQYTTEEGEQMRSALAVLAQTADTLMFGVCGSDLNSAVQGLVAYGDHFGYPLPADLIATLPPLAGAVYLKFNPRSQKLYADGYQGSYRGVLISFQSDLAEGYSGTHGHMPVDLYNPPLPI